MSKLLWIFDAGHGGLNPAGKYVTPGKRSGVFPDGSSTSDGKELPDGYILYEGVNNRDNVRRIISKCLENGIDTLDLVPGYEDISLGSRCRTINRVNSKQSAITISLHVPERSRK